MLKVSGGFERGKSLLGCALLKLPSVSAIVERLRSEWNYSFLLEPVCTLGEDEPPSITVVTSSK